MIGVLVKRWPFTHAEAREQAYRRALRLAGFLPHSIDVMVDRDRNWIERGQDK